MRRYMRTMRWCLRHRGLTMVAAAVFFAGSISLVPLLPTGFVPAGDRAQTQVKIELPPGATLIETRAVAERVRLAVLQVPHIKRCSARSAAAPAATPSPPAPRPRHGAPC